mmetsp:Transcript_1810/g.3752  ORF Transcript_1810/g.3752 Transcript_1810/m.3752 type:complete len:839 (-) Transcript_1810:35-2551(-)
MRSKEKDVGKAALNEGHTEVGPTDSLTTPRKTRPSVSGKKHRKKRASVAEEGVLASNDEAGRSSPGPDQVSSTYSSALLRLDPPTPLASPREASPSGVDGTNSLSDAGPSPPPHRRKSKKKRETRRSLDDTPPPPMPDEDDMQTAGSALRRSLIEGLGDRGAEQKFLPGSPTSSPLLRGSRDAGQRPSHPMTDEGDGGINKTQPILQTTGSTVLASSGSTKATGSERRTVNRAVTLDMNNNSVVEHENITSDDDDDQLPGKPSISHRHSMAEKEAAFRAPSGLRSTLRGDKYMRSGSLDWSKALRDDRRSKNRSSRWSLAPTRQQSMAVSMGNVEESSSDEEKDDDRDPLRLPNTHLVMKLRQKPGSEGFSFLEMAYQIIDQIGIDTGKYQDELAFLKDCIHASPNSLATPCGLANTSDTATKILKKSLSSQFALAKTSAFRVPHIRGAMRSVRKQDNDLSPAGASPEELPTICQEDVDQHKCPWMGRAVPRFPVHVDSALASRLEKALYTEFDDFNTWSFDVMHFHDISNRHSLMFVGWEAFCRGNCFAEFGLVPKKAANFFARLESLYCTDQETPYHNNIHAADVVQNMNALLFELQFSRYCDPMDTMGLLLSAAIHDAGHDGRNNTFHLNLQDDLALTYNDKSVLEHFHVSQGWKLILGGDGENNFVEELSVEQAALLRREVISMVLSTDLARHFTNLSDFRKCCAKQGTDPIAWHEESSSMDVFRGTLLHAADTANPTKPLKLANEWSDRCMREFFRQGDEEAKLGLPISPMCNRHSVNVAGTQIGFIDFVTAPLFRALIELSPRVEEVCIQGMMRVRETWENRDHWFDDEDDI